MHFAVVLLLALSVYLLPFPEGVSYSIVLMNIIVPLIREELQFLKPFGTVKEAK